MLNVDHLIEDLLYLYGAELILALVVHLYDFTHHVFIVLEVDQVHVNLL